MFVYSYIRLGMQVLASLPGVVVVVYLDCTVLHESVLSCQASLLVVTKHIHFLLGRNFLGLFFIAVRHHHRRWRRCGTLR